MICGKKLNVHLIPFKWTNLLINKNQWMKQM